MIWLSLDTSSPSAAIALFNDEEYLGGANTDVKVQHSENLLGAIHETLKSNKLTVQDLDGIAVGIGPGSFTGLRIGLSTVRAICQALELALTGVPSLVNFGAQFEKNVTESGKFKSHTLVTSKAFRGEFFFMEIPSGASFQDFIDGKFDSGAITPKAWIERLNPEIQNIILMGSGADIFKNVIESLKDENDPTSVKLKSLKIEYLGENGKSDPLSLYKVARRHIEFGDPQKFYDLKPLYIRPSEAERKLNAGLLKPSPVSS